MAGVFVQIILIIDMGPRCVCVWGGGVIIERSDVSDLRRLLGCLRSTMYSWYMVRNALYYGPKPLKSTWRHGHFLNLTCNIGLSDMRQGV